MDFVRRFRGLRVEKLIPILVLLFNPVDFVTIKIKIISIKKVHLHGHRLTTSCYGVA